MYNKKADGSSKGRGSLSAPKEACACPGGTISLGFVPFHVRVCCLSRCLRGMLLWLEPVAGLGAMGMTLAVGHWCLYMNAGFGLQVTSCIVLA